MRESLLVGCGGFIGAASRFYFGEFLLRYSIASRFPLGTLSVNALGCFLIGLLVGVIGREPASTDMRLFMITGVLGGFTTFSAFGFETIQLLRQEQTFLAMTNIAANLILGLLLVALGLWVSART